jgi:hypothetical protein
MLVGRRHSLRIFAPVRTIFALIVNLIAHTRNIYAFSSVPVWSLACTMRQDVPMAIQIASHIGLESVENLYIFIDDLIWWLTLTCNFS